MASEWAMKTAEEVIGIFDCTSSKKPLRLAIAAEIDAARIKGMEEAAEIADAQSPIVDSKNIARRIRAAVEAQKAGKG